MFPIIRLRCFSFKSFVCFCLFVLVYCGRAQALAQAIKEAKEQHPDMSVTRVVVHKETELAEDDD